MLFSQEPFPLPKLYEETGLIQAGTELVPKLKCLQVIIADAHPNAIRSHTAFHLPGRMNALKLYGHLHLLSLRRTGIALI
jgi:hypothetical protein